jgi:hypothetical protein
MTTTLPAALRRIDKFCHGLQVINWKDKAWKACVIWTAEEVRCEVRRVRREIRAGRKKDKG